MRALADRVVDDFVDNGRCDFVSEYAIPLATRAVETLLGDPTRDRVAAAAVANHDTVRDTVANLLGTAVRILAENPGFAEVLRHDRSLIDPFVEETLRFDGPTKVAFRIADRPTSIGNHDLAAGTVVMLGLAAANRDPRKFVDPSTFRLDRTNVGDHVSFGQGTRACTGAPLIRTAARVTLDRLLDRMRDIRIRERAHGPAGDRMYVYEPTFLLRGLVELHIEFTPVR
ncbi:cytochrome P450 [Rhodococcus triatomae]